MPQRNGYSLAAGDNAVMERVGPPLLEIGARRRSPGLSNQIICRCIVLPCQQGKDLMCRPSPVKGSDERLDDACGPVAGAQIRPRLKVVVSGNVPGRKRRRLVGVASRVKAEGRFGSVLGELQIGRRVVAGVCTNHHERVHDTGRKVPRQIRKLAGLPAAGGLIRRFDQVDRRLQFPIDPVDQRVRIRRKRASGKNHGVTRARG